MLPSFSLPPLDEVVLGVQFTSPPDYNTLHINEIYNLFKDEYPRFDEQPRVEPQFETFGGHAQPGFQMQFGPAPLRNRAFFVSEDENHLIQFQDDRLLLNWRQGSGATPYPRFSRVFEKFNTAVAKIEAYYLKVLDQKLLINQAEISYTNIIKVQDFVDVSKYFKFINLSALNVESVGLNFTEVIFSEQRPIARLHHEMNSVWSVDGRQKALRFSLTLRGKPEKESSVSAKEFLNLGHTKIVQRFSELTTEVAHSEWGKQ